MASDTVSRAILSVVTPPILFPAVIAWSNLSVGFDDDTTMELSIYYFIGFAWILISVGLWRMLCIRAPKARTATYLISIATVLLVIAGLLEWNWQEQVSDYHPGPIAELAVLAFTAGIAVVGATTHAYFARIPFRIAGR